MVNQSMVCVLLPQEQALHRESNKSVEAGLDTPRVDCIVLSADCDSGTRTSAGQPTIKPAETAKEWSPFRGCKMNHKQRH